MAQGKQLQPRIRSKLRGLRAALHSRLLSEGIAWMIIAAVALVFLTLLLDYLLRLDKPLRVVTMAACLGYLLRLAWRQIVAPLRVPMDLPALALLVENRYRQMGDRLISALQLAGREEVLRIGMSQAMIDRMVDEAGRLAAELNFGAVVERTGLRRRVGIALATGMLLAGFAVWQADVMSLWFQRNILFADRDWPQDTYLRVLGADENGDFHILRGDSFELLVLAEEASDTPSRITIHARYPSIGWTEDEAELSTDGSRRYVKVYQAVTEPFEFYVAGGDDRRDKRKPHHVILIDPPALQKLAFGVHFPPHMVDKNIRKGPNEPDKRVDGTQGLLAVPVGSRIHVVAEANKDLRFAGVSIDGERVGILDIHKIGPASRGVTGYFQVTGENKPVSKMLRFDLVDGDGHPNRHGQQFVLQIQPDLTPTVSLKKYGVGTVVTPQATIPLWLHLRDDYGLDGLSLHLGIAGRKEQPKPVEVKTLRRGARELKLRSDGAGPEAHVPPVSLKPHGLVPGDSVTIHAAVIDNLPPEPNRTESGVLSFPVVRPEELFGQLIQRQKEVGRNIDNAIQEQVRAHGNTTDAAKLTAPDARSDMRRLLGGSGRRQAGVATECAKSAEALAEILGEMIYNELGQDDERRVLQENIILPLAEISKRSTAAASVLAGLSRLLEGDAADMDKVGTKAGEVAEIQAAMLADLRKIHELVAKVTGLQDVTRRWMLLLKGSRELLDEILNREEDKIRQMLQKDKKDGGKD